MGLISDRDPAEVVRAHYLASAAGDLDALRATLAPDIEWTEMEGFPLAGTYRTPEVVTESVMVALGQDWEGWTAHDDRYVVQGEDVVVLARYTARNRHTGKHLRARVAHHFTVRGGLIVRFEQFVDTALVRDAATPERERTRLMSTEHTSLITTFYELAFNEGRPEEAAAAALGSSYTQHNPEAQDGPDAFVGYVHWLRGQFPDLHLDIKRVIADGDLVVTHSNLHLTPGDLGMAVADIWRIADGKIVEHWDVVQQVPEKSANANTMF